MTVQMKQNHIVVIDYLRGIASLSVLIHHWTCVPGFITDPVAYAICDSLNVGVYIFFVLSGFVMPYAMHRGGYVFSRMHRFFLKRIVRLDPAFFTSIAFCVATNYLSTLHPAYVGVPFEVDWLNISLHFAYLCPFFNQPWVLGGIFWTLGIEAQFYVAMAFLFPLLMHRKLRVPVLLIITAIPIPLLIDFGLFKFLPAYAAFFGLGMIAFLFREKMLNRAAFMRLSTAMTAVCLVKFHWYQAVGAFLAMAAIVCINNPPHLPVLSYFGKISYSLYLFHFPISNKCVNYLMRFPQTPKYAFLIVLAGIVVCVLVAHVVYYLVERPSQRWAARLSY